MTQPLADGSSKKKCEPVGQSPCDYTQVEITKKVKDILRMYHSSRTLPSEPEHF